MLSFLFNRTPSKAKFAELVLKELEKAGAGSYEYSESDFSVSLGKNYLSLVNLYAEYCQTIGEHRKEILFNVRSLPSVQNEEITRVQAYDQAMAVIRERVLASFAELEWEKEKREPGTTLMVGEPISDGYCRSIVVNFPAGMRMIGQKHLDEWGFTFEELYEIGLEKLRRSSSPAFREINGVFVGTWSDDYDASRALLPELLLKLGLDGDPPLSQECSSSETGKGHSAATLLKGLG